MMMNIQNSGKNKFKMKAIRCTGVYIAVDPFSKA